MVQGLPCMPANAARCHSSVPLCGAVASALAALRIGVHHRAVAETATNAASSRSHCLLTLHLEAREERVPGLAIMQRAKFTMVDLAGKAGVAAAACESVSVWMRQASLACSTCASTERHVSL